MVCDDRRAGEISLVLDQMERCPLVVQRTREATNPATRHCQAANSRASHLTHTPQQKLAPVESKLLYIKVFGKQKFREVCCWTCAIQTS